MIEIVGCGDAVVVGGCGVSGSVGSGVGGGATMMLLVMMMATMMYDDGNG